ncbi:MAG: PAS domain S-box protein [Nitrospirota bacterium]|nr:PAS domain S-box protein [Nitrospirota bacterium]
MSSADHLSELESLRSQVAALTCQVAERDHAMEAQSRHLEQAMQDLQEQSHLLRTIIEGTAADTGDEFFASLVTHLTATLQVQYAIVGEVVGDETKILRTLAVSVGGVLIENIEYALEHAPCGTGLDSPFWCFEQGVQARFPHFPNLATLGVESHCGVSLKNKAGEVVGLLIVMDTKPLRNSDRLKSLMEVFASRTTAELHRYRAEVAQRDIDRRLQFTQYSVDHAVDGVLWADESQRLVYANEAARRALGYSIEELLALSISDIVPHHDPSRFQQRLDQVKQGTTALYESVHRRKDGTEFPIEVSVIYLEYQGEGYTCGLVRDITERKRVEEERQQALLDRQNIMETIPDILFTLDCAGNLVNWNSRLEAVTGYTSAELMNKPALHFVPAEEQAPTMAAIQQAFTEGYAELLGHLLTKEHCLIPYRWTGALLKNQQGLPIGITGVARDISDMKRAEEALKQQRRHLVDAQALAHLGSWEWDIDNHKILWSDEMYRIFGHEPGSTTPSLDTFLTALLPDDHDRVLATINDALLGTTPFDMEYRIVCPNSAVHVVHARGEVHRDATGHPLSMAGTVLDITERKTIEQALRSSEERWQLALQGSNDGIWDWNISTGEVFFSPRWKALRGFDDHEITNHVDEWQCRIHPEDLERVLRSLDAYLTKQASEFCEEYRVQRKDGSYMWILDRGAALWADDGTALRMAGSESDITARKQAEDTLRDSEARSRSIVETALDAIIAIDMDGRIVGWNPQAEATFGYSAHEAIGRGLSDTIIPPQFRDAHFAGVQRVVQNQESLGAKRRLEFSALHRDGHEFPVEFAMASTQVGDQPVLSAFVRDITERKRAESKLRLAQFTIDHAVDAVYWINREARIIEVNEAASLMLGYSKAELCAMTIHDLNPDFQADGWPVFWAETQQCKTMALETFHRSKAGQLIPVEVQINYLSYDGQELHCAFVRDITERKRAEEALRESEVRYRTLVELSPSGVFVFSEGRTVYVNQTGAQLMGATDPAEILKRPTFDFIHPDYHQEVRENVRRLLTGGTSVHRAERVYQKLDGTTLPVQVEAARITWNGKPAILGLYSDITERKRVEDRLRTTQYAVDHATEFIFVIGSDGYFLDVNESACQRLGYTKEELLTKSVMDIDPDFSPDVWTTFWEEFKRKKLLRLETRHRSKSGEIYPVEVVANFIVHEGKELDYAFVRDITERKRAEEQLCRTSDHLKALIEVAPLALVTTDAEGTLLSWNPGAQTMFGWTEADVLGRSFPWVPPGEEAESERIWNESIRDGGARGLELRRLRKDGSLIDIKLWSAPMRNADGAITHWVAFFDDITELKQAHQDLRRSEQQLRTVLDTLPVGVWFTDARGQVLYGNAIGKQIWSDAVRIGLTNQDSGKLWWETTNRDAESPHRWAIGTVMARGGSALNEMIEIETAAGTRRSVRNSAVPIRGEAGEILGAIILNEDVTDRMRAEAALRQHHALLSAIMDAATDVIFVKNRKGQYLHMNQAGAQALGMPLADVIGWTDYALWPPELAASCHLADQQVLQSEAPVTVEEGSLLGGRYTVYQTTKAPFRDPDGKIVGIIGISRDITERKQSEEALRLSEERFAKAFRSSPYPVVISELESGLFVDANDAALELFSYRREDLSGHSSADLHLWLTPEVRGQFVEQLTTHGTIKNAEVVLRDKSGEPRHCRVSAELIELHGKRCMVTVGQDVTEQKAAEDALKKSHALLSAIMETTIDIIFVKDLEGRYLHMNHAGARVVGMTAEEVVGKGDDAIWPADLVACCKAADRQILTSGTAQTMEESTVVDGKRITYLTTKAPYRDATGRMIGIIGVAHDITQIKRSEDELRRSHAFLRQIIDTDPNFIFAKDREGRFTLVNQAVADAYGTTVDKLIGKTDAHFNPNGTEVDYFSQKDREVFESLREVFLPEEQLTDAKGNIRWLQTVKRPMLDEEGRVHMVLGASSDITERKRMEETLRRRERDLRAALDERERISQDLHDGILQSLFAVGLGLEATKSMMSPKSGKTAGPSLDQAIAQLNHVMHEIRNFIAGLDSDLLKGKDLPTALQQMLDTMTQHQATRVRLAVEDRAAQAISTEQSMHLLLVIQEAVSNCIRHGRAHEARVSLKMLKQGVRLSIRDDGRGFSPEAVKGTGHGLINMAARAQKIGGRFTVTSKIDRGTRVVLDLPKEESYVHP